MQETTLFTWTSAPQKPQTLTDALCAVGNIIGNGAIGIFYSPKVCCFGVYHGGSVLDNHGLELVLGDVFEARVFNEVGELRWWNDPQTPGKGKAAYLSEIDKGPEGWTRSQAVSHRPDNDNTYLLWGEYLPPQSDEQPLNAGWSRLAAARTGAFSVPISGLGDKDRAQLCTVEYIGSAGDKHGNMAVIEERLAALERVPAQAKGGGK
jgi:CRISPR-associated protein (TIGR03984 family)